MDPNVYLSERLGKVLEMKGQDLFLKVGSVPRTRVGSQVLAMPFEVVTAEETKSIAENILNEVQKKSLEKNLSVDFAFSLMGTMQRFRANIFRQQGVLSLVIRTLWKDIPSLEQLKIPPVIGEVALAKSGIILIGGTVASGKTTTLHAMIETMNNKVERHVVTVEDPVEYLHTDKKCIINQREIGEDAVDFHSALRHVVRQSPDVVVMGEMRDAESFHFAISSAEVGRLVLATVHAKTVVQIIDRVLGFYPPDQRDMVLNHLYPNISCFMIQKLVLGPDGKTLVPCFEIMLGNHTTKQLIKEKQFEKIPQALRNGTKEGMMTMDQSIHDLWKSGAITKEVALASAARPQELENQMKGIQISGQTSKILGS